MYVCKTTCVGVGVCVCVCVCVCVKNRVYMLTSVLLFPVVQNPTLQVICIIVCGILSFLWLIIIGYRGGGVSQEGHISDHDYSSNFHEKFLEMTPGKIL